MADRDEIVLVLLHLAVGFPAEWLPAGFNIKARAELALRIYDSSDYVDLMAEIYQAVRHDVFSWVQLLGEPDLPVRVAVGFGLAWFREEASAVIASVRQSLERADDESEIVNHILTLGLLNGYLSSGQDNERFRNYFDTGGSAAIRTCAAIALANTAPQVVDDGMVAVLLDALDNLEPPPIFHWNNGFVRSYAALSLGSLSKYTPERVVPGLCDAITFVNPGGIIAITSALGEALFPAKLSEGIRFSSLNQYQKMFLKALADNWLDIFGENVIDLNFVGVLRTYGFPDSHATLAAFVSQID